MKQPKPFFRRYTRSWYVQIGKRQIGKRQICLGRDKKAAWEKYHQIMASRHDLTSAAVTHRDSPMVTGLGFGGKVTGEMLACVHDTDCRRTCGCRLPKSSRLRCSSTASKAIPGPDVPIARGESRMSSPKSRAHRSAPATSQPRAADRWQLIADLEFPLLNQVHDLVHNFIRCRSRRLNNGGRHFHTSWLLTTF